MHARMGSRFTAVMLGLVLGGAALAKEPAKQQVKEFSSRSAISTRLDAVM